jgi:hypothetical protein
MDGCPVATGQVAHIAESSPSLIKAPQAAPRAGASARPLPWEARPARAGPTALPLLINEVPQQAPRGQPGRLPQPGCPVRWRLSVPCE